MVPHVAALAAYVLLAVAFTWPLPLHLATAFLGPVDGDLGAYVWNLWVFRHELMVHHNFPWTTVEVLSLRQAVPLTLQNYVAFADLLAVPILPTLGIVATFNLLSIGACVISSYAMFVYARVRTGDTVAAWIGGVLFGLAPYMLARQTAHFSLTLAAPLPLFALVVYRLSQGETTVWMSVAAGLTVAWAYFCDPYYAIYCLLIVLFAVCYATLDVEIARPAPRTWRLTLLDVAIAAMGALAIGTAISGGGRFVLFGQTVDATEMYTPVLATTLLIVLRLLTWGRFTLRIPEIQFRTWGRIGAAATVPMLLLLSPVVYAMTLPYGSPFAVPAPVFWRSSAPGLDVLAYLLPNPLHLFSPESWSTWLERQPNGLVENVASLSWVAMMTVVVASLSRETRPERRWFVFTAVFALLSLGPFLRIAGVNTFVPTPWALLRYVPVLGTARMPTRLAILTLLGLSMLLAMALQRLRARSSHPTLVAAAVGALLVFELMPGPRLLASAEVPRIISTIAADPRDVRVVNLPFGLRDGLGSRGDYASTSQYYQTVHEKPLLGGYLSRLPEGEVARFEQLLEMAVLLDLSEGRPVDDARRAAALTSAQQHRAELRIGWLVVNTRRASPSLVAYAREAFAAEFAGQDGVWMLYRAEPAR